MEEMIKLYIEAKRLLAKCNAEIAANIDHRPKMVGDRVIVWDGSYSQAVLPPFTHYMGIELDDHVCIVVATNQQFDVTSEVIRATNHHNLDIIVYSPKYNCEIRVMSDTVKLVENENIQLEREYDEKGD